MTGVLLDNSALIRLWKCEALDVLRGTVELHVAGHVAKEFQAQGPAERAAFARLGVISHGVRPGLTAWSTFSTIRGGRYATRDLGEAESLAVALAEAEDGRLLPFVTYDKPAAKQAGLYGVVALDFLDTLSWLVGCGVLTAQQADDLEALASATDGWWRPVGYAGSIEAVCAARQQGVIERVEVWRATFPR